MDRKERRARRLTRLDEAVARLRSELPAKAVSLGVRRALLFGSTARGTHDWRSDIDLIVVQETDQPFVRRGQDIIAALGLGIGIDLLVYTPSEWAGVQESSRLVRRAVREGETLYVADA